MSKNGNLEAIELWRLVLTKTVENASEVEFLKVAFHPSVADALARENGDLLRKFALRFFDSGFHKSALALTKILSEPTNGDRLLMAKCESLEGNLRKAILHLAKFRKP